MGGDLIIMDKVKYVELKKFMLERNIKQQEMSDILGIDRTTFNSKLNAKDSEFTLREMRVLCKKYELDANKFFLNT